jgi:hypothetical protein
MFAASVQQYPDSTMSGVAIEGLAESDGNGTYGLVNVSQADGNHATFRQVTTRLRGYKLFHDGVAWTVTLADDEDTCWAYATSAEKQPWKIRADEWHVYTGKEWAPAPPTFAVREAPGAPHFQPQGPPPEPHANFDQWLATKGTLSGCQQCKRLIFILLWMGTWAWVFVSLVRLPSILGDEEEYGYGYGYDSNPCYSAPCDYSSWATMQANGWTSTMSDPTMTTDQYVAETCSEGGTTWFGWDAWGVGATSITLPAAGAGSVDFGNCWDVGECVLYVGGAEVARAYARANHVTAAITFQAGDVLELRDEGPNSVCKLSSISVDTGPYTLSGGCAMSAASVDDCDDGEVRSKRLSDSLCFLLNNDDLPRQTRDNRKENSFEGGAFHHTGSDREGCWGSIPLIQHLLLRRDE